MEMYDKLRRDLVMFTYIYLHMDLLCHRKGVNSTFCLKFALIPGMTRKTLNSLLWTLTVQWSMYGIISL